jgi:hypothetical protein
MVQDRISPARRKALTFPFPRHSAHGAGGGKTWVPDKDSHTTAQRQFIGQREYPGVQHSRRGGVSIILPLVPPEEW